MEPPKNKEKLLDQITFERESLDDVLGAISTSQFSIQGVEAEWSIKDILVHIVFWEGLMVSWMEEVHKGLEPQMLPPGKTWDDLDEINQDAFLENQDRDLDEVLEAYHSHYPLALASVKNVPQNALMDPGMYPWRRGTPLWEMVAANTSWHYKEHRETITKWIKGR
jgi:hypothetical protein